MKLMCTYRKKYLIYDAVSGATSVTTGTTSAAAAAAAEATATKAATPSARAVSNIIAENECDEAHTTQYDAYKHQEINPQKSGCR